MRRRSGHLRRLLVAAAAVLALAGCELRADLGVVVDRDGGGTLTLALTADAELVARAEEGGVDPLAEVADVAAAAPGWSGSTADLDGGGRRVVLRSAFEDAEELAALTGDLAEALAAPELAVLEPFRVELTDDTVTVVGGAGLVPGDAVTELGLSPAAAVEALAEAVDYRVAVTLPGAVLETTATTSAADGEPLVWQVPAGERVEVRAVGERPPPWWWWPAIGGAVGLVVLLGGGWWWRRRRGGRGAHAA